MLKDIEQDWWYRDDWKYKAGDTLGGGTLVVGRRVRIAQSSMLRDVGKYNIIETGSMNPDWISVNAGGTIYCILCSDINLAELKFPIGNHEGERTLGLRCRIGNDGIQRM